MLVAILVPRGRTPFGQHQESRPLARSNDIPVLNGFVNTIDWDQNQSDLSDLTLSMRRVMGSPWIADFRFWTWPEVEPEVAILAADQKERGHWGRECAGGAGGKKGKLLCCKRIFDRIKASLAEIQLKKHHNVKKMHFLQKFQESMG